MAESKSTTQLFDKPTFIADADSGPDALVTQARVEQEITDTIGNVNFNYATTYRNQVT